MKTLPKTITFLQFPSITAYDDDDGEEEIFGLRDKDGKYYIGNKEAKIKENNIIVGNKEYAGILELWELIVARSPDDQIFTNGDYDNYAELMHSTNALRRIIDDES